jgi:Putative metallopeptidase
LLYRTAIGLIDVLKIPVWGRYTDAADTMAAIVMLRFGPAPVAEINILGMSAYLNASAKVWIGPDFSEIRSPTVQRYYNYACLAFGSDPIAFKDFKEDVKFLLRARFIDGKGKPNQGITDEDNLCKDQFLAALKSFNKVMASHIDEAKRAQLYSDFTIFEAADFQ